jgi:hypothetical protein
MEAQSRASCDGWAPPATGPGSALRWTRASAVRGLRRAPGVGCMSRLLRAAVFWYVLWYQDAIKAACTGKDELIHDTPLAVLGVMARAWSGLQKRCWQQRWGQGVRKYSGAEGVKLTSLLCHGAQTR